MIKVDIWVRTCDDDNDGFVEGGGWSCFVLVNIIDNQLVRFIQCLSKSLSPSLLFFK